MRSYALLPFMLTAAQPALAQAVWSGEGSLSAGITTGNTETSDVGVGLDLTRDGGDWKQTAEISMDYAKTDGAESKNRFFSALQLDRGFDGPRWSAYGRVSHEQNQFSGFNSRTFFGGGVSYEVLMDDPTNWTLQGGPGYKIDNIEARLEDGVVIPSTTEETIAFRAGSRFSHKFNEAVALSDNADVIYSDTSTQIVNELALTASLVQNLSARISLDVRHDTDAPQDSEPTDTATRFSLVYSYGD